ncbi:alpha/beta fold hydrolase [Crossiella cryophila]|uniref:Alpha/beta hydrolase n=1 Tax=Crossiella cryophila TaxID=43355 RepID=A0A7W7CFK2_9PSEU|nr:alpha/beta fold hydrolase [Crossiella cryophila]MBB4680307.1 hypothetical protein [Crossiella cryophila]
MLATTSLLLAATSAVAAASDHPCATATEVCTGTVLVNMGGPVEALPTAETIIAGLGPVLDQQNLLMVELRGFDRHTALSCEGIRVNEPETVAPCAAKLGARAQFFTTDQAVRDHDAVRAALGVPKVTLFGNSYGTVSPRA